MVVYLLADSDNCKSANVVCALTIVPTTICEDLHQNKTSVSEQYTG